MGSKKGKKEKGKSEKPKNTNTEQITMTGSIALSKLQHVMMKKKGKKGKKIECIVIPLDANFLSKGKDGKGIYMDVRVIYKPGGDDFDQNGFISQTVGSKLFKDAKPKEQEKMRKTPILGSIKNWDAPTGGGNDNSGSAGSDIDESDDLPF